MPHIYSTCRGHEDIVALLTPFTSPASDPHVLHNLIQLIDSTALTVEPSQSALNIITILLHKDLTWLESSVNREDEVVSESCLHLAAQLGLPSVVKTLLDAGTILTINQSIKYVLLVKTMIIYHSLATPTI
jgi:hypothetical protein